MVFENHNKLQLSEYCMYKKCKVSKLIFFDDKFQVSSFSSFKFQVSSFICHIHDYTETV